MSVSELAKQELVSFCVTHLDREDGALAELNRSLQEVRLALQEHDTQKLPSLLEAQQQQMSRVAEIRAERNTLRQRIADALHISDEQASVTQFAATLDDSQKATILACRERVAERAAETTRLAEQNMAVVTRGMQLLAEVMHSLTGDRAASGRYQSDGHAEVSNVPPIHQTQL